MCVWIASIKLRRVFMALKKICRCGKLIDAGVKYCDDCIAKYEADKAERNKIYDTRHRNKQANGFYHSKPWLKTRAFVLSKYDYLDLYAYYVRHEVITATLVHHVVELSDDWDRRLDIANLLPVSLDTHNAFDALYRQDKQAIQQQLFEILNRFNTPGGVKKV